MSYVSQMLEYERIDVSEGIDVNKTNVSKECDICLCWYLKDISFKCQLYHSYACYDLMQKAISFHDLVIVNIKRSAYRIYLWYMRKNDAISIMNNSSLVHKKGVLYFLY